MSGTPVKQASEDPNGTITVKNLFKGKWRVLLFILIMVAIGTLSWVFYAPSQPLICSLGLILTTVAAYRLTRTRKKINEPLKESNYDKFRRLEGLYHTIPALAPTENQAAIQEFTTQMATLESFVDQQKAGFTREDADDLVHNLHLAYLQVATVDYLHLNIQTLESEYKQAVGPTLYEAYLAAIMRKPTDPPLAPEDRNRLLRSEATYLANETRRQQLLRQHAQSTRQSLLSAAFRSWWATIIPLLALLVVFLFCLSWVKAAITAMETNGKTETAADATTKWTEDAAKQYLLLAGPQSQADPRYTKLFKAFIITSLLCLAGVAGATGGTMSVIQRVQAGTPENDPLTDLLALSQAQTAVSFAPVTGMIFAVVLSLFFAGGVLSGSFFPSFEPKMGAEWFLVLFDAKNLAIWLLWAFVAGFSERLVPDALDTLVKQQADNNAKAAPAGARNGPQNQLQPQVAGQQVQDAKDKENAASKIFISTQKAVSGTSGTIAAPASSSIPVPSPNKVDNTQGNIGKPVPPTSV